MLVVERSNRTERLLAGLASRLMRIDGDPLAPSLVVVQGPGMERWVAQTIAERFGICANVQFPFPRPFLEQAFEALPPALVPSANRAWERPALTWAVARQLGELVAADPDAPELAPLRAQLEAADGEWRQLQLARRLARLFDQYITFRPAELETWLSAPLPDAPDARWQARLYRGLRDAIGAGHFADRARGFREAIAAGDFVDRGGQSLPERIEVFAVSTLPPLYVEAIDALARVREVHLSILSPTPHYWADLWRELRDAEAARSGGEPDGLFTASPGPFAGLLSGLGRLGGEFQSVLEERASFQEGPEDLFERPTLRFASRGQRPHLLARLQSGLLEVDDPSGATAPGGEGAADRCIALEDDSIRVHVCAGVRRELEVVRALLVDAFERDASLTPEDVIVMAPRVDQVAAEIDAVFGAVRDGPGAIPYRIADRGLFARSPVADALRSLLDLLGGRARRGEVFDWLAREPVRRRFGLEVATVESLADWAARAGYRFAFDEDHREALGLARDPRHTLSGALVRLALAHAVGESEEVFAGSVAEPLDPYAPADALGALGEVATLLSAAHAATPQRRDVAAWCRWLTQIAEATLIQDAANAHEHAAIREALDEVAVGSESAGFREGVPFEAAREAIREALDARASPQAFLAGGVTFCEFVPLRAIPFRIVAMTGLGDAAFPRARAAPAFDLIARHPRPGDRTTRGDDRYLFLEALLSARDKLILTVPGRDLRTGREEPPSVVVSELLDVLDAQFDAASSPNASPGAAEAGQGSSAGRLRDQLIVEHPLHGFSPRYFVRAGDTRLVSHDAQDHGAALAHRAAIEAGVEARRRFLTLGEGGLPGAGGRGDRPVVLTLEGLIDRVLDSTRFFVERTLQLTLPRPRAALAELDPHALDPLERWGFVEALLARAGAGLGVADQAERLAADPRMPGGAPGRLFVRAVSEEADALARLAEGRAVGDPIEPVDFELALDLGPAGARAGSCQLKGRLDALSTGARVEVGASGLGGKREQALWIRHLALCAVARRDARLPTISCYVGRPESRGPSGQRGPIAVYRRVEGAHAELARLALWALEVDRAPLPFFPGASRAFARERLSGAPDRAWRNAHERYHGSESDLGRRPEAERGLEAARLWEGGSPLDDGAAFGLGFSFEDLAREFFEPLLASREVVER